MEYQESEIEQLVELEFELFPDNNLGPYTLRQELSSPNFCGILKYSGSNLTAYSLGRVQDETLDLLRIGVHPDYQGRGIGTSLLLAAIESAKFHPTCRGVMLTVRKDNDKALRLYHKLGFKIDGDLRGAWTMLHSL